MVSPVKAPLKLAPKALDGVGVKHSLDVLVERVVNAFVVVAHLGKAAFVSSPLVGVDLRFARHVFKDKGHDAMEGANLDGFGPDLPFALHGPHDGDFLVVHAITHLALAAHVGFVNFHRVFKRFLGLFKQFSYLKSHAPRRFVGNSELSLKFHSRNPVLGIGKQEDGEEP